MWWNIFMLAVATLVTCVAAYNHGHQKGAREVLASFVSALDAIRDGAEEAITDRLIDEEREAIARERIAERLTEWQEGQRS